MKKFVIAPTIILILLFLLIIPHFTYSSIAPTVVSYPIYEMNTNHKNILISNHLKEEKAEIFLMIFMKNRTYFDVYENGKKVIHVTKNVNPKKEITFSGHLYNTQGNNSINVAGISYARQKSQGTWIKYSGSAPFNRGDYDLAVEFEFGGIDSLQHGSMQHTYDGFGMRIFKYPVLKKQFSPFGIWSPWNVKIVTDDYQEQIASSVITYYQRFYLSP